MAVPEEIKALKSTDLGAVEIRCISGHYYVYEISSKWDSKRGKAKKVTGKTIGKLTLKDGFIPNIYGMRKTMPLHSVVKNYCAYAIQQQLSGSLEKSLKENIPDIYREISVIAMLQLISGCREKRIRRKFEASYLNDLHPNLTCNDYKVRTLIGKLGSRRGDIDSFMRLYMKSESRLMFYKPSIFTKADDNCAQRGYNSGHRQETQVRLLYIFDHTSFMPVFYRIIHGNITDRTALLEAVTASGCRNGVIIADKGFFRRNI